MPITAQQGDYQNMGGHLFNPPIRCNYKRIAGDDGVWTDFGCCVRNCLEYCPMFRAAIKGGVDEKQILETYRDRRKKAKLPVEKAPVTKSKRTK